MCTGYFFYSKNFPFKKYKYNELPIHAQSSDENNLVGQK